MKYSNAKAIFNSLGKIAEDCDEEKSAASRDQKIKAHSVQVKLLDYEIRRAAQRQYLGHKNVQIRNIEATGFDSLVEDK